MLDNNYYNENDYIDLNKYNKHTGAIGPKYFCVIRVQNKKIKNASEFKKFEMHMERKLNVLNADPLKIHLNRIVIGSKNVFNDAMEYIKDVEKIRKNANLGRDLILTASREFFITLSEKDLDTWIEANVKFLKNKFGNNCIYAAVHLDETTPHIHALIIPKFYNGKKKRYELRSNIYFDGIDKLKELQDEYCDHMKYKFNCLKRGIRGSKAKHVDIKQYYALINSKLDKSDEKSILSHAKASYLRQKRIKELEETIEVQKEFFKNENNKNKKLIEDLKEADNILLKESINAKRDNKVYIDIIKKLQKEYNISKNDIEKIIDSIEFKKDNEISK